MSRRLISWTGMGALVLAVVMSAATPAQAQRRGGRWGGGNWGYGGYGRGWDGGWGDRGLGLGYGLGYGWGRPYWGDRWYGGYNDYSPGYYGFESGYTTYSPDYYSYGPSTGYSSFYTQPQYGSDGYGSSDSVLLNVRVPPDAQVWIDGQATWQRGSNRQFQSPPLDPNANYTYEVRARWMDQNGREVERTRRVPVHAGERKTLDLMASSSDMDRDAMRRGDTERRDMDRSDMDRRDMNRGDLNRNRAPSSDRNVAPRDTQPDRRNPEP
jgi:uncharacterized protein (TIGR03000 family)